MTTESSDKPKVLGVNALHQFADYSRTRYHLEVDDKTSLMDILRPGFWAHHSTKLKRFDIIEVVSGDLNLDCELRVIEVGNMLVHVRPRFVGEAREIDAEALADGAVEEEDLPELPPLYTVHYSSGADTLWYVRSAETTPPTIISQGHESRAEAYDAAIEHHAEANNPRL